MASLQQILQNQENELKYYNTQKQIQSNKNLALQLQKEERNFGFKPHFDTQGNSNLAQRIGDAERAGASDEDIEIILSEHDYVRDSMLSPMMDSGTPSVPQPAASTPPSGPASIVTPTLPPNPTPRTHDRPSRPVKKDEKKPEKKPEKKLDLLGLLKQNLPLILLLLLVLFIAYKVFDTPSKGSKGKKGKGKGKGKKK